MSLKALTHVAEALGVETYKIIRDAAI